MKITITHVSGALVGQSQTFDKDTIVLGRYPTGTDVTFHLTRDTLVSKLHAHIIRRGGSVFVEDQGSTNGTFVHGQRIVGPTALASGDSIELGVSAGGPSVRVRFESSLSDSSGTVQDLHQVGLVAPVPLVTSERSAIPIGDSVVVGRADGCDIQLDSPMISARHAVFERVGERVTVRDLRSTNGTFVNGKRITPTAQELRADDVIAMGGRFLSYAQDGLRHLELPPAVVAVGLIHHASRRFLSSEKPPKLLDRVSLKISPGQFVGIMGPSGAGKSTLLHALSGLHPADHGRVLLCNLDLYEEPDQLLGRIGYVPQKDILHDDLTVWQCLHYASLLRLPADMTAVETERRIASVLERLSLSGRASAPIRGLSGGERKRVSTAMELLAEPDILFLDEPTAGLDPKREIELMETLRDLSRKDKTVIIVTHMLGSVELLDRLCMLVAGGRMAFYGPPSDALEYFQVDGWSKLYCTLDENGAEWARAYGMSTQIASRDADCGSTGAPATSHGPLGVRSARGQGGWQNPYKAAVAALSQLLVLSRRMGRVLANNPSNLGLLVAGPALLGAVIVATVDHRRDALAMTVFTSLFFGCFVSSREIVKEREIFLRERLFNLSVTSYVISKVLVLGAIVAIQALAIVAVLGPGMPKLGNPVQLWLTAALTGLTGMAEGLLLSSLAPSADLTTTVLTLLVIVQMLFAGIIVQPSYRPLQTLASEGRRRELVTQALCLLDPAFWALDDLERTAFAQSQVVVGPPENEHGLPEKLERDFKDLGGTTERLLATGMAPDASTAKRLQDFKDAQSRVSKDIGDMRNAGKPIVMAKWSSTKDRGVLVGITLALVMMTLMSITDQEQSRRGL